MKLFRIFAVAILALRGCPTPAFAEEVALSADTVFTPSATLYATGQCIGPAGASAVQTIQAVQPSGDGGAIFTDAQIVDGSGQGTAIDLYLFNAKPSGTYTDQAVCALAAADLDNVIGPISFTSYVAFGTAKTARIANLWQAINMATANPLASSAVYFVLVSRGAPTFGASQTLVLRLGGYTDRQ